MQSLLMKARASLETRGVFSRGAVMEPIADSWHRCLQNGLDPRGEPVDAVLSYRELREARERNERLIAMVRPELELLSKQIAGTNYMTAFADKRGVVLDVIMDNEFRESDCSRAIRTGSIWREEVRGTNGLGLALHTGETSMVTGAEHFFARHAKVSCVSTPIFDSKGEIVGLLDASSEVAARQFHTQALVSLAAMNVENRLFVEEHRSDHIIQFHPREEYLTTQSVGMISTDDDGRITGVNRHAVNILKGLDPGIANTFSDLFQGGFGVSLKSMANGEAVRLVDWLNSSYFARIRITRQPSGRAIAGRSIALSLPAVYRHQGGFGQPVYRDEQVCNALRLALRAARQGLALTILGDPGSGRTTLARTVHDKVHKERPMFVVDCRTANLQGEGDALLADLAGAGAGDGQGQGVGQETGQGFCLQSGGTLVVENLSLIRNEAAERLAQLTNRLRQSSSPAKWVMIATDGEAAAGSDWQADNWQPHVKMAFSHLSQLKIHLPCLSDRSDFSQIAAFLLNTVSPGHQLSNTAIEALRKIDRPQNLHDLSNQLQVLAVHCPVGVIRREHVERLIEPARGAELACTRCAGNSAREAKCREINRIFRQCNANVSLAARKLGVSRNTVYSHLVSVQERD